MILITDSKGKVKKALALFMLASCVLTACGNASPASESVESENYVAVKDSSEDLVEAPSAIPATESMLELSPEPTLEPTPTEDPNTYEDVLANIHSHLDGSDDNRMNNIRLAIEKVDGQVIQAGEIFSFNDCVGETTAENGYKDAYIYCNNGHYPEDEVTEMGGGVNQVASNMYCASLYGVLEPVERYAHHFAFSGDGYLRRGRDAYICNNGIDETKDLKIQNTYDAPVKIHIWIDEEENLLCTELEGTNPDGLQAEPSYDTISHYLQAKPDVCYMYETTSYRTITNKYGYVDTETLFTDMYYWHERDYVWT